MEVVQHKSTACIVISKSGTTTEPAIAFRLVKQHLYERYGTKEAIRRIVAITDPEKGALRKMAETEGFRTFYSTRCRRSLFRFYFRRVITYSIGRYSC